MTRGYNSTRATWLTREEREQAIREQITAGVHDPAAIAAVLRCSKERVLQVARGMTDVEPRMHRRSNRTRCAVHLYLKPTMNSVRVDDPRCG